MNDRQKRIAAAATIATALAVPAEGLRQYAYKDTGGILTVCYGHTGKDIERGKQYSLAQCEKFLDTDMLNAVLTVENCTPGLPPKVLGAFGDVVYNSGSTAACDLSRSTAAKYLKAGKLKEACNELPKWNKARVAGILVPLPGLATRRIKEKAVCLEDA